MKTESALNVSMGKVQKKANVAAVQYLARF